MTTNNTTATSLPVRTDTAIAALYRKGAPIRHAIHADMEMVRWYETRGNRAPERVAEIMARVEAARAAWAAIRAEIAPLEAVYEQHRWTRAFLVVSSTGGHVHKSMSCATCRPETEYDWRPEYSGADEATIVADAGERACTVCFPTAPVGVTGTRIYSDDERAAMAARDTRAAAKVARDAKRAAAAPNADGTALTITERVTGWDGKVATYRRTLATEVTARREYAHMADMVAYARNTDDADAMRVAMDAIVAALAGKHGITADAMRAELAAKAAAKRRRDGYR